MDQRKTDANPLVLDQTVWVMTKRLSSFGKIESLKVSKYTVVESNVVFAFVVDSEDVKRYRRDPKSNSHMTLKIEQTTNKVISNVSWEKHQIWLTEDEFLKSMRENDRSNGEK